MIGQRAAGALVATAALLALSACSGGGTGATGPGKNGGGGTSNDGVLTIGATVATNNQFPQNFNVYGGGDSSPATGLFYETLFRVSAKDGGKLLPNLALSEDWSKDFRTQTYHLRPGVKWSDGVPFTCEDVAYSYNFIYGPAGKNNPKYGGFLSQPITCGADKLTVVVHLTDPDPQRDVPMSLYYPIYPAHIWKNKDQHNAVDKNPIGTGPGKLVKLSGQRIEIAMRDDYWGGGSKGVKKVVIVPAGSEGNIESQITNGQVDIATGGAPGVLSGFAKKPGNGYNFYPDGSTRGIIFNTTMAPLNDPAVRRALRDSVDLQTVADVGGVGYSVPNVAGLSTDIYASDLTPPYDKPLAPNVDQAKKDLAAAGWTVKDGNLTKGGKSYPLTLTIENDNPVEMVTSPVVVDQWKKNLGIVAKFDPKPAEVFQAAQAKGDYQMSLWTTNAAGSPLNAFTMYQTDKFYKLGDSKADGNYGRWHIPAAAGKALIPGLLDTPASDTAKIKPLIETVDKAFDTDAPILPLENGGAGLLYSTNKWSAPPAPGSVDYYPRVDGYNNIIKTVMNMTPAS